MAITQKISGAARFNFRRKALAKKYFSVPALLSVSLLFLSSCSGHSWFHKADQKGYYKVGQPYQIEGKWYTPKEQFDYDEVGMASWYGSQFHNKQTANGGIFDRHSLTAAHKTLPLPSMVRVTNLDNNKTLIVMVNDRGPFAKERIIDMSERAADVLGFKKKGIAKVRVQYLPGQTKRLLADLPGAKDASKALASTLGDPDATTPMTENNYAANNLDAYAAKPIDLDNTPIPRMAATPVVKVADTSRTTAMAELPNINIDKTTIIADENPVQKTEIAEATPIEDTGSELYTDSEPDAEIETKPVAQNKVTAPASDEEIANTAPAAPKPPEEKIAELSQEVHYIQAGTYGVIGNAKRAEKSLESIGTVDVSKVKINGKLLYRVKVGPIMDQAIAKLALRKVVTMGHPDAIIVTESGAAAPAVQ